MTTSRNLDRTHGALAWALVAVVFLAGIFFGAIGDLPLGRGGEVESAGAQALLEEGRRYEIRHIAIALAMATAALSLLFAPRERQPRRLWIAVLLAYPAWSMVQAIPLPAGLVSALNPARAQVAVETWPGPVEGCSGALIAAEPPATSALSYDALTSRETALYALAAALIFLAARAFASDHEQRKLAILAAIAAFAGAEAIYGLVQWTSATPMVLWREKTAYLDSATGTLINRNHFAQLLYLGMGAALALFLRIRRHAHRELRERAVAIRVGLVLLTVLLLFGTLASRSRAGLGGAALVIVAAIVAYLWRHGRPRFAEVGLALLLIVPIALVTAPAVFERLASVTEEWTGEASRGEVYRTSMGIVGDHPLLGTGAGTFGVIWGLYRTPAFEGDYNYAHNDYLQVLIESGAPGLVLAILPLGLFAFEWFRERRRMRRAREDDDAPREHSRSIDIPVMAALLAVALHEFVDFGLQVPVNLFLTALLAGTVAIGTRLAIPEARTQARAIATRATACIALALVPVAAVHSLARWPGWEDTLPWPRVPSVEHRVASDLFDAWRRSSAKPGTVADACASIARQSNAQRLLPVSATYAVGYATKALAALESGALPGADAERVRDAVSRSAAIARRLDPWHSRNRNRLVTVSIALGELDRAMDDARAVARVDSLSRRLIRSLLDLGIPPAAISSIVIEHPIAYRELLRSLLEEWDAETLAALVPVDPEANPAHCGAGSQVADVLRRLYKVSPRTFLESCLPLATDDGDVRRVHVLAWLAREAIDRQDYERARELSTQMEESPTRDWTLLRLAQVDGRWDDAAAIAQRLIEVQRKSRDQAPLASLYASLAEAHAHRGRLGSAIEALERALSYDPALPQAERRLGEMRRGINPYPRPQ